MTSKEHFLRTVSEQLNRDDKKQTLLEESYSIGFLSTPQFGD